MPRLLSITLVLIWVQFPDLPASLLQASDLLFKEETEEPPGLLPPAVASSGTAESALDEPCPQDLQDLPKT